MEKRHCPYLRIIDDPTSSIAYPHEVNACHRAKKPVKVILEYQESHCLCDAYQECPGYTKGWEKGFPLELRADYDPTSKNIFKRIQFWREEQQKKKAQKEKQKDKKEKQDLKEALQSKLQFRKKQPDKEKEKTVLEEEPVRIKAEVQKEPELEPAFQPQTQLPEKTILQDEAALKEYLKSKRRSNNPLLKLFSKKTKTSPNDETKEVRQSDRLSKEEQKPKRDWKTALRGLIPFSIIPGIKKSQNKTAEKEVPQVDWETEKPAKQKKSLKETLQNILPWHKEKPPKQDRTKAIKERLSLQEEEPNIDTPVEAIQAPEPLTEEEPFVETSTQPVQVEEPPVEEEQPKEHEQPLEQEQPVEEEPEQLPNEWVKEEELAVDYRIENIRDELVRNQKQQNKGGLKKGFTSIFPWKKEKPERKPAKKEPRIANVEETAPQDVLVLRDKKKDEAAWKKVFKNRQVWWVSLGIILIFMLVIFIPQLPSVNLNIRDRLEGLFNPPVSETTAAATETPIITPENITLTDVIASGTTEVPSNTPSNTPTAEATPTTPPTATITPTTVPTLTPTPGPPSLIPITRTP